MGSSDKEHSSEDVIRALKEIQGSTPLRQFAEEIGCSAALICKVYKGDRDVGPKLLGYLGLERHKKVKVEMTFTWK